MYLPGLPKAARSMPSRPGLPPPTLRITSCSARPMAALARLPWPSTLWPGVHADATGDAARSRSRTGPEKYVVQSRPWMLNVSVQAASTAASTTGRYSGLQPAITALMATFSTVTWHAAAVGRWPRSPRAARVVPSSMRSTRASVGGDDGQAVGPAPLEHRLDLVLERGQLDRRACRQPPSKRTRSRSAMVGSTDSDPQPGPVLGQTVAEPGRPAELLPVGPGPALGAGRLLAALDQQQGRDRLDVVVVGHVELGVVDPVADLLGEGRVVLGVHGDAATPAAVQLGEHGADEHAGRAVALDHGDDAVG